MRAHFPIIRLVFLYPPLASFAMPRLRTGTRHSVTTVQSADRANAVPIKQLTKTLRSPTALPSLSFYSEELVYFFWSNVTIVAKSCSSSLAHTCFPTPHWSMSVLLTPHWSMSVLLTPHLSMSVLLTPHWSMSVLLTPHWSMSVLVTPHWLMPL